MSKELIYLYNSSIATINTIKIARNPIEYCRCFQNRILKIYICFFLKRVNCIPLSAARFMPVLYSYPYACCYAIGWLTQCISQLRLVYAAVTNSPSLIDFVLSQPQLGVTQEPGFSKAASPVTLAGAREADSALGIKCPSDTCHFHSQLIGLNRSCGPNTPQGQEVQSSLCPGRWVS